MSPPESMGGAGWQVTGEIDLELLVAIEFTMVTRLIGNLPGNLLQAPPDWRARDSRLAMLQQLATSRDHLARAASLQQGIVWDDSSQSTDRDNPIGFTRN